MATSRNMHPTQTIFADAWFRFDRYEIKDGYVRPAASAKLIGYEPWEKFAIPTAKKSVKQPYEPLLELARRIEVNSSAVLVGNSENLIIDWCSRYGLLGLLPHRVQSVVLSPRLGERPNVDPVTAQLMGIFPVSTTFTKTNSGWADNWLMPMPGSDVRPGVYLRKHLNQYDMDFQAFSMTWGHFFPDVAAEERENYQYPAPYTQDFWHQYAEPAIDIALAAQMFAHAVDGVRLVSSRSRLTDDQLRAVLAGDHILNVFASSARPMLFHSGIRRYGFGWASHSLLTAYTMMVMFDLASARVLQCANPRCRGVFVSKSVAAKYCSRTCRGTVQMQKYRKRKKKELALKNRRSRIRS